VERASVCIPGIDEVRRAAPGKFANGAVPGCTQPSRTPAALRIPDGQAVAESGQSLVACPGASLAIYA